jgi:hypothetical protein
MLGLGKSMAIVVATMVVGYGTMANENTDWDWEYHEQKQAYEEWEDHYGGEVYIYETGEVIDTGDVDAAEAIIDMGYGERTMEPPNTDMVKEYTR